MRIGILSLFVFLLNFTHAQPGGGGGLHIHGLFTQDLEAIRYDDPALSVSAYLIDTVGSNAHLIGEIPAVNSRRASFGVQPSIYYSYYRPEMAIRQVRFLIAYGGDTMLLDMAGIIGENPIGFSDFMDSLCILPGHYVLLRNKVLDNDFDDDESPHKAYIGFTPFVLEKLKKADVAFGPLRQKSLGDLMCDRDAGYYLFEAYLQYKHEQDSLADLAISKAENLGIEKEDTLHYLELLSIRSAKQGDYISALSHWKNFTAIVLNQDEPIPHLHQAVLEKLIGFQERTAAYTEALESYDMLIKRSENLIDSLSMHSKKLRFQLEHFGPSQALLLSCNQSIARIPENHLAAMPYVKSPYSSLYFVKGSIAWELGEKDTAENNWFKAMHFGLDQFPKHWDSTLDSLIAAHPERGKLFMIRALKSIKSRECRYRPHPITCFQNPLNDLKTADSLGVGELPVHWYQAELYKRVNQPQEALKHLKQAEQRRPEDPMVYRLKMEVRKQMGENPYTEEDPDNVKFRKLLDAWRFPKY